MRHGVHSETGRLRTVMVHRPGIEHRRTLPWNKDALLFDDIIDVEEARPQHDGFVAEMRKHGTEVLLVTDLLDELCGDGEARRQIFREVVGEEKLSGVDMDALRTGHLIAGWPDHFTTGGETSWDPLPNLYFMRDPAFAVPGAIVISHPFWPARQRESRLIRAILTRHPRFRDIPVYDGILEDPGARIEGGDVLVVDGETVLVGIGERTNEAGAAHLQRFLFERTNVKRVLRMRIPAKREFMHLDTVLTFVDHRRILTMPHLWDRPELYAQVAQRAKEHCAELGFEYHGPDPDSLLNAAWLEIWTRDGMQERFDDELEGLEAAGAIDRSQTITVAGEPSQHHSPIDHVVAALREQWNDGANVVALEPRKVLAYSCNDRTHGGLTRAGIEVVSFPGSELVRGRGGARCMTMPIERSPRKRRTQNAERRTVKKGER